MQKVQRVHRVQKVQKVQRVHRMQKVQIVHRVQIVQRVQRMQKVQKVQRMQKVQRFRECRKYRGSEIIESINGTLDLSKEQFPMALRQVEKCVKKNRPRWHTKNVSKRTVPIGT